MTIRSHEHRPANLPEQTQFIGYECFELLNAKKIWYKKKTGCLVFQIGLVVWKEFKINIQPACQLMHYLLRNLNTDITLEAAHREMYGETEVYNVDRHKQKILRNAKHIQQRLELYLGYSWVRLEIKSRECKLMLKE